MQQAKHILLLLSDRIGDVLFATPAIALLGQYLSSCQLDALAPNQVVGEVVAFNPALNTVWQNPNKATLKQLDDHYDMIIALSRNGAVNKIAAHFKKTPIQSFEDNGEPLPRYEFFVNFIRDLFPESVKHTPPKQYQLFPQAQHYQKAKQVLSDSGVKASDRLIACHLGCHRMAKLGKKFWRRKLDPAGSKSWFTDRYQALNQQLQKDFPEHKLVLIGTKGERKLANDLLSMDNVIDVMGQTNVLALAALLTQCDLLITCDTGPLHIACAMATPLVALFGKTDPRFWGPYPPQADRSVVQADAMENITVEQVYAAVKLQLQKQLEVLND